MKFYNQISHIKFIIKNINKIPSEKLYNIRDKINYELIKQSKVKLKGRAIIVLADKLDWDWVVKTQDIDINIILAHEEYIKDMTNCIKYQYKYGNISVYDINRYKSIYNRICWKEIDPYEMDQDFNNAFGHLLTYDLSFIMKEE